MFQVSLPPKAVSLSLADDLPFLYPSPTLTSAAKSPESHQTPLIAAALEQFGHWTILAMILHLKITGIISQLLASASYLKRHR